MCPDPLTDPTFWTTNMGTGDDLAPKQAGRRANLVERVVWVQRHDYYKATGVRVITEGEKSSTNSTSYQMSKHTHPHTHVSLHFLPGLSVHPPSPSPPQTHTHIHTPRQQHVASMLNHDTGSCIYADYLHVARDIITTAVPHTCCTERQKWNGWLKKTSITRKQENNCFAHKPSGASCLFTIKQIQFKHEA